MDVTFTTLFPLTLILMFLKALHEGKQMLLKEDYQGKDEMVQTTLKQDNLARSVRIILCMDLLYPQVI